MYKKNRNSLIHKRLIIEAKSKVVIRWVRTGCWHCRLFVSLFKPSKCSIALLRFSTFYYQSYWPKEAKTVSRIRAPGIAMHALPSSLEKLLDLIINQMQLRK
jgi:hypothetical protein